ncbi:MAG: peptide chain release factor 1 [Patescibacteria group bacterium]
MDLKNELQNKIKLLKKLEAKLADPAIFSDPKKIRELNEEYSDVKSIVAVGELYIKAVDDLKSAKQSLDESQEKDYIDMAQEEIDSLTSNIPELEEQFVQALVPPDPFDRRNIIVEIRAGTGGDEAALFASDLFRLYTRYAEKNKWKTSLISSSQNDIGGFKEVIFSVSGQNVYSRMKYESGVHRVQRVPDTEKQGRVHTSTATVAVLPEAEEVDIHIDPKDLKIEATTSTGAGGQSVNTTYSAIRITHIPSGTMVYCQDERSQAQNKEKALQVIRTRVFAAEQERLQKERSEQRKGQVGTGERSEKIRTYNYPQDRITDHRINENFHNLPEIMEGELDEIIEKLKALDRNIKSSIM